MSPAARLFRINADKQTSRQVREAEFAALGLRERSHVQEWIAKRPSILGDDLLVIAKEYDKFDRTDERLDLLAVDRLGNLVIIELKRDDTGADVHWQAIKYASYLSHATPAQIVGMLAAYSEKHLPEAQKMTEEQAANRLAEHIEAGDLANLNRSQRIIIASHRFAREVTSAVLWLNERMGGDVITCVQLTPHQDGDSLYLQANTLIPVPGTEGYRIGIGDRNLDLQPGGSSPDTTEVRKILSAVVDSSKAALDESYVPNKFRRHGQAGWWRLSYDECDPWGDGWGVSYKVVLQRRENPPSSWWQLVQAARDKVEGEWVAAIYLAYGSQLPRSLVNAVQLGIEGISTDSRIQKYDNWSLLLGVDELNEEFVAEFADMITRYIKVVTPEVNQAYERGEFADEEDEEDEEDEA